MASAIVGYYYFGLAKFAEYRARYFKCLSPCITLKVD